MNGKTVQLLKGIQVLRVGDKVYITYDPAQADEQSARAWMELTKGAEHGKCAGPVLRAKGTASGPGAETDA